MDDRLGYAGGDVEVKNVPQRLACFLLQLAPALFLAQPLALAAAAPPGARQPAPPAPPPSAGGETVEVDIRIVPFCAVDAAGKPISDLRQDEVELRIGGRAVAIDTLDRTVAAPGGVAGTEKKGNNDLDSPRLPC